MYDANNTDRLNGPRFKLITIYINKHLSKILMHCEQGFRHDLSCVATIGDVMKITDMGSSVQAAILDFPIALDKLTHQLIKKQVLPSCYKVNVNFFFNRCQM